MHRPPAYPWQHQYASHYGGRTLHHNERFVSPGQYFGWSWTRNAKKEASINLRTDADRVAFDYRHRCGGGDWKNQSYPVLLAWTPCNYGGRWAWFLCPAKGCGRRAALLYVGRAGIFACRQCYRLAYSSQRETADNRTSRRADKIRVRLGWEVDMAS